nr:DUF192 domain-containing protein [uncultured Anaeromusa sp.]
MKAKKIWVEENAGEPRLLVASLRLADSFWSRLKGLLGTAALPERGGLLLRPCNCVHTCGMRYAIDVLFLDSDGRILKLVQELAPWRSAWCWQAAAVLELPAGTVQRQELQPGQQLRRSWS